MNLWFRIGFLTLFLCCLWLFSDIENITQIKNKPSNLSAPSISKNQSSISVEKNWHSTAENVNRFEKRPVKLTKGIMVAESQSDLLMGVIGAIRRDTDIVQLSRFYSEHNLSFSRSERISQFTDTERFAIKSLSLNSANINNAEPVNALAWSRTWYRQMYLVKKSGHPGNFGELAVQINKIRHFANETNFPIAAIRYHTYSSFCKMLISLGNPSQLPIPLMLTFKLDPTNGHLTEDIPGKTCIKRRGYKRTTNTCSYPIIIPAYLRRCRKTIHDLKNFIDHSKILLLVTNQNVGFASDKVLVLPQGVRPTIAIEAMKFIEVKKRKDNFRNFSRPILFALSNAFTGYQDTVVTKLSQKFGISAVFTYDGTDEVIATTNLSDYFELLMAAKFTICPPGLSGLDTYRIWEALLLGSIPVVEASPTGPGWERSFSLLPVLVVNDFLSLTKTDFEAAYQCFLLHKDQWRYDLLTQQHWDEMIIGALRNASRNHILLDHPSYNPYCNFFLYNKTKHWN